MNAYLPSGLLSPFTMPAAQPPLLVCFSHLRWDFVWQRPQHLLSRAVSKYRVLFIEEPIFKAEAAPHIDISQRPGGVTIAVPVLPEGLSEIDCIAMQKVLVKTLLSVETGSPRIFWYYTPAALAFSRQLDCDLCIYDNMDELSAFSGASKQLLDFEAELFERADVVLTGGQSLFEAKKGRHHNVHAFPSSIDFAHFAKARRSKAAEPADQAGIPSPRLGFFGVVDERMNIDLVGQVADLKPNWQFVMLGPVVKIDPASLPQRANIHWLGAKNYQDLPSYLAHWDIGFMPFALNEATRFISPTKTPEFLAAGVPVISTAIKDVVTPYGDKDLVSIAGSAEEVVSLAQMCMVRPKKAWLARVDRHLSLGSWDKTWGSINRLMTDALGGQDNMAEIAPYAALAAE